MQCLHDQRLVLFFAHDDGLKRKVSHWVSRLLSLQCAGVVLPIWYGALINTVKTRLTTSCVWTISIHWHSVGDGQDWFVLNASWRKRDLPWWRANKGQHWAYLVLQHKMTGNRISSKRVRGRESALKQDLVADLVERAWGRVDPEQIHRRSWSHAVGYAWHWYCGPPSRRRSSSK